MPTSAAQQHEADTVNYLKALNKYIPSLVLSRLVQRAETNKRQELPELQKMETCVLFADISGFTMLGEACAKQGVRGNEELAFCINRYMEGMVKTLSKYGGDIIKFVGDALIVMWPEEKGLDGPTTTVRKAIQCCLDIQKEFNNFQVITNVSPLSVKLGIGYGECGLLYVGGVFGRAEFFTIGTALVYALRSEGQATSGGQIIVSETAFKYVRKLYSAIEILSEPDPDHHNPGGEKFYQILNLIGEGIKTRADALVLRGQISDKTYLQISNQLRGCLPAAIIPYLQIGAEQYGSETRSLTVMFASLGIELSSASKEDGMQKIQKIFQCVQECVYRQGGSLNKLVMDDKGSTLVCLWGLSPMAHEDDAARAILTAFNMRKELRRRFNTSCNIGISSGEMFSGVVGTSGGRKEFSVLGDVANLAARIMYWPISRKLQDKINVDFATRTLAANQLSFIYGGHYEFKGKSISIPIFEPIDSHDELAEITKKMLMPGAYLKPHLNPMNLERQTDTTHVKSKMCGPAQEAVQDLAKEVTEYFSRQQCFGAYMAAVKGEVGQGKTLFARTLIDELRSNTDFKQLMRHKNFMFCSSLNAETQYSYLNAWRPILTQLMTFHCARQNIQRHFLLYQLLLVSNGGLKQNEKFINVLCQIFMVDPQLIYNQTNGQATIQAQPKESQFPFVTRATYTDSDQILAICLIFIKMVLGEHEQQRIVDSTPIILIFDSTHMMDSASWSLFDMVKDECNRVCIILLQLCDDLGELVISSEALETFNHVWHSDRMDELRQIELPCLNSQDFYQILKAYAGKYQTSYLEEVKRMTDIVADPYNPDKPSIKTPEAGEQWIKRLTGLWQLKESFKDVDRKLLVVILKRCYGNPLLSLAFFVHLLQNTFIVINAQGKVVSTPKFDECINLDDFLTCPAPRIAIKQNLAMIDKYQQKCQQKQNKRPGELEQVMKSIVMMKAATVLGDFFDSKSLQAMNPLRQMETIPSLNKMLKMLEAAGFIEIQDESNHNYKCRFNRPFLRETIYQVVLFRDVKQGIHGAAASYLLQNNIELVSRSRLTDPVVLVEVLKKHMMLAQDCNDETELTIQARTGLIVKRTENILDKDPKALVLNEYIYKQGQAANKKTSSRLCTIDSSYFRWYHNEKELKAGTYLGSVPIQFIYQTVSSKMAWVEKPSFSISTTQWFDKYSNDQGRRDFYFACDNQQQMEKWIIIIEFLRTKAVYDNYTQRNIPVLFPIAVGPKRNRMQAQIDHSEELHEFGRQLKQHTQIRLTQGGGLNLSQTKNSAVKLSGQDLAQKLKQMYGLAMVGFVNHVQQTAVKVTVRQQSAQLGKLPPTLSYKIEMQDPTVYTSQISSQQPDDTQRQVLFQQRLSNRRYSAVSADHVAAAKQLNHQQQQQYLKNDLIHEETEGQTSDSRSSQSKVVHLQPLVHRRSQQLQHQELSNLKVTSEQQSDFARERGQSPPLSLNAPLSQQHTTTQQKEQSFVPGEGEDEGSEVMMQQYQEDEEEVKTRQSRAEAHSQNMMHHSKLPEHDLLSLQQFISQSIEQGVQKLIQTNQEMASSQRQELSKLIVQNYHQLNRSFDTPFKSDYQIPNGVTSSSHQRVMSSAQVRSRAQQQSDSEPQSPSLSPVREFYPSFSQVLKQHQQTKDVDWQSARTLKRSDEYQLFEEPIRTENQWVVKGHAVCINDSTCQQDRRFKIKAGASVQILEVLPNFKLLRVQQQQAQGLFLMKDFEKQQLSPIAANKEGSFFMDVSASGLAIKQKQQRVAARILQEDLQESKNKSLKMVERLQRKKRRKSASINTQPPQ